MLFRSHPDSECASEAAKKYIRLGASPRAGQALISAAKVKALMKGRLNVAYSDINELAYPVLRHRMKMNFEAIANRVSPDEVIKMILDELAKKFRLKPAKVQIGAAEIGELIVSDEPDDLPESESADARAETSNDAADAQADDKDSKKGKRKLFKSKEK